jgi:hypothetical protein
VDEFEKEIDLAVNLNDVDQLIRTFFTQLISWGLNANATGEKYVGRRLTWASS